MTSYVAQLVPLPHEADEVERKALYRVAHFANSSLDKPAFFHLGKFGGPKFRSLLASVRSAMMRTAIKSVPERPEWKAQITTSAQEALPFDLWLNGIFQPGFWDSPPIALNLANAHACFLGDDDWADGARRAFSEIPPLAPPCAPLPRLRF